DFRMPPRPSRRTLLALIARAGRSLRILRIRGADWQFRADRDKLWRAVEDAHPVSLELIDCDGWTKDYYTSMLCSIEVCNIAERLADGTLHHMYSSGSTCPEGYSTVPVTIAISG